MSGHRGWEEIKAQHGLSTGAIVPPEQVIASLKRALAQRWDQVGELLIEDFLQLLNRAEGSGTRINGVIEGDGGNERQVYSVGWYNGMEWCETRITRGESVWEAS